MIVRARTASTTTCGTLSARNQQHQKIYSFHGLSELSCQEGPNTLTSPMARFFLLFTNRKLSSLRIDGCPNSVSKRRHSWHQEREANEGPTRAETTQKNDQKAETTPKEDEKARTALIFIPKTGEDRAEGASFTYAFLSPLWGPKKFFFQRNGQSQIQDKPSKSFDEI